MFQPVTLSYRPPMRRLMIILSLPLLAAAGVLMYHHSGPDMFHHGHLAMYHHGRHLLRVLADPLMHFHG